MNTTPGQQRREDMKQIADDLVQVTRTLAVAHLKSSLLWRTIFFGLTGLSSLAAALAVLVPKIGSFHNPENIATALAGVAAILSGLAATTKPSDHENSHSQAGIGFNKIADEIRLYRTKIQDTGVNISSLESELKKLQEQRHELDKHSPGFLPLVYRIAIHEVKDGRFQSGGLI